MSTTPKIHLEQRRGFRHSYLYVPSLINFMSEILTNVYKNEHMGAGERA